MTERSSRESGGTGNAGAGAGRGGRDVGGQRDSKGQDRGYRGNQNQGRVSPDKLKQAYKGYGNTMMQAGMANLAGPPGYNAAVHDYNNRSLGWDVLDFFAGPFVNVNRPNTTIPGSYSGGTFHTSTNVPGAIGAIGSAATGMWGGGLIGSTIADGLGIPDVYHGSYDDGSALHSPQPNAYNGNRGYGASSGYSGNGYDRTRGGLLGLGTTPKPAEPTQGLLGLAAKTPEALRDKTARQWGFGTRNIPGPTPYNVQTARWL